MSTVPIQRPTGGDFVRRHNLSTRLWHWISAAIMTVMLMSGLMIFNAHPRLYWGSYGANPDPAWLEIGATQTAGYLRIGGTEFDTTGVLGVSKGKFRPVVKRAFPEWSTLPANYDLAVARRWHLSFAWFFAVGTMVFGIWSLINGHVRRDLLPHKSEISFMHFCRQCQHHIMFRRPTGAEARNYNILQKLSYLGVSGVLIPTLILSGLTMSPWINAVLPWLLDLFGGRQSARSIHFISAFAVVLFVVIHLIMVLLNGPFNEIRSMITGWFRLPKERQK